MRFFRKGLISGVLLLMLFVALPVPVAANTIGTVRYVEVIAAHPRMLKFDFSAGRFVDGASAQIDIDKLQVRGRELEAKLQQLSGELAERVAILEKSLAGSSRSKKSAEQDFWSKKKEIEEQLEAVRDEIAANIAAMEFGGRTIETTVLPEVNQIMADVTTAISAAAKARNCSMVMNEPLSLAMVETNNWIEEGYSLHLRHSNVTDPQILKRWVSSVNRIVPRISAHVNLLKPIVTGSVDLTADAIKLLTQPIRKGGVSRR